MLLVNFSVLKSLLDGNLLVLGEEGLLRFVMLLICDLVGLGI